MGFASLYPSYEFSEISLDNCVNQNYLPPQPVPPKGTMRIVIAALARVAMGRCGVQACFFMPGESAAADGEVVWTWRRDPGATLLARPMQQRGQERPFPGVSAK